MRKPGYVNNWKPETRALLNRLTAAGFTLVRGSNGEESFTFDGDLPKFIAGLTACDESHVYVKAPAGNEKSDGASCYVLYLVYGNSPGELVCDYSVHPLLDTVTDAHYEEWSEKAQPTKFCQNKADMDAFNARAREASAAYALKRTLQAGVATECFNDA